MRIPPQFPGLHELVYFPNPLLPYPLHFPPAPPNWFSVKVSLRASILFPRIILDPPPQAAQEGVQTYPILFLLLCEPHTSPFRASPFPEFLRSVQFLVAFLRASCRPRARAPHPEFVFNQGGGTT